MRKSDAFEKSCFSGCADITLCGSMQLNRGKVAIQNPHILNNKGIDSVFVCKPRQANRVFEFLIVNDGVKCHVDAGVKAMGEVSESFNIGKRIGRFDSGTKTGTADIDGIGSVQNGFNTDISIFCRR